MFSDKITFHELSKMGSELVIRNVEWHSNFF